MFMRMVFLFNLTKHLTPWNTLIGRKTLKGEGLSTGGFSLHFRSNLKFHPVKTLIFVSSIAVFTLAFILRIFERPYYVAAYWDGTTVTKDDFSSIFNAIWLTVITMTTVGYGDFSAVTVPGRVTTIIIALTGSILMALLVSTMSSLLLLDSEERKVLNKIQQEANAALAIQNSLELNVLLNKYKTSSNDSLFE